MRSLQLSFVWAGLSLSLPLASAAGFGLFSSSWGNVIVSTDMTDEGRALTPPTTSEPVYYVGKSLGCTLGSIPGDHLPDEKELNRFVARVLAKQGYLVATPGGPEPTRFLVIQWGYLLPHSGDLLWFLGYDENLDIAAPVYPGQLGPEVWRQSYRSNAIMTILEDANNPIYGIIVTAFEYQSARTTKPTIYWQTRIGLQASAKTMAEALTTMVAAAGPSIGREARSPVLVDADDARAGRVELGELEVRGIVEEPAPRNQTQDANK